jgi:hypothetical protein
MPSGLNPISGIMPWAGLRTLISRNSDIFIPGTKVVFTLKVPREHGFGQRSQPAKVAFVHYDNTDSVGIEGVTKSWLGIVSKFKLDVDKEEGEVRLPQFNSSIELNDLEATIHLLPHSHPDIETFTWDSLDFLGTTMSMITDPDDKEMDEVMNLYRLRMYPHRYN